ncbi:MAG TPA: site-specific DNA-methyltransferase [Pseudonocardiaceae bacterium]|nr:site-specific DNA-methyltransferase [Pseudonocardiaceae bacterium]
MPGVRLEWDGKAAEVPRLRLPLQVIETVNAARDPGGGWRNKLIWGDNLHVLASMADELAGQVDLIYIDPPFDSRQDYKVRFAVGDGDLTTFSPALVETAYRDTWGTGVESYLQMLYQRLVLLRELLSDRGSLFLHLAPNVSHLARGLLDEIFGPDNFRAEIIWKRATAHADAHHLGAVHEDILWFSKTEKVIWNQQYTPYEDWYVERYYRYRDPDGRRFMSGDLSAAGLAGGGYDYEWKGVNRTWRVPRDTMVKLDRQGRVFYTKNGIPRIKRYLDEAKGQPLSDVWSDINPVVSWAPEKLGYDTQKPAALLERIITSSSDEGSIVLDCFVGSGTTAAVAEKLKRRWVAIDIGRFAIHTTRKRLLDIPQCAPFVVANLGRYERRAWQGATTGPQLRAYLDFVVTLYGAAPVTEFQHLHATKGGRAVHVGAIDTAVSFAEIKEALDEAAAAGHPGLDVLGWEFERGLHELAPDEARARGIDLRLRRIPREVMDPRAVESGEVVFHELACLKVTTTVHKRNATVTLTDFVLSNPDLVPAAVRSKISGWADYVDYWAVDFTYGAAGHGDTFHNQWQSYRTRANRRLVLNATHDYDEAGIYTILVKVIDIFGNDTSTAAQVSVT